MKLNFMDRMMILNLLPETGTYLSLKTIRVLREALAPTPEEVAELCIVEVQDTGQITWDNTKDSASDIVIGEIAFEMIKSKLKEMDKDEELTANHENIYKLFVD